MVIPYSEPRCITEWRLAYLTLRLRRSRANLTRAMDQIGKSERRVQSIIGKIHAYEAEIVRVSKKLNHSQAPPV